MTPIAIVSCAPSACVSLISMGCALFWTGVSPRTRRDNFRARVPLTPEEMRAHYYVARAVSVEAIHAALHEIGSCLHVPPGQLRPSDRFDVELAPVKGWDWDDGMPLLMRLARRRLEHCGRSGDDIAGIATVDDYVRLCAREIA